MPLALPAHFVQTLAGVPTGIVDNADEANPVVSAVPMAALQMTFIGAFSGGLDYAIGDVVFVPDLPAYFVAIQAFVNGSGNTPPNAAYWQQISLGLGQLLEFGVIGPAGATDNSLCAFNGPTGKLIKEVGTFDELVAFVRAAIVDDPTTFAAILIAAGITPVADGTRVTGFGLGAGTDGDLTTKTGVVTGNTPATVA